jgi:hypothetical protein
LLREREGFRLVKLSESLKALWRARHRGEPARGDLQDLENEIRVAENDAGALARKAFDEIGQLSDNERVVVDGIRT